jgi:O-antigen ligase
MLNNSINQVYTPYKYLCLLCASIVPLLVTGSFLPDLLISLTSLWFIYYTIKKKLYYIYQNKFFYIFIAFCIVCIISSLLSDDIALSFESSLFYFRIGIFALLISYLIDQNKKILDYFYYVFLITFSSLIIDGYFQYFTGFNLFGYPKIGIRVSSFFGKELILGSYLARLFPLLFALFVVRSHKHSLEVYFISILFILINILVFLSGERASFILFNISNIFIIFFISNYKLLRIGVLIISLCIIFIFTLKDESLYFRFIKSPIESIDLNSSGKIYIFTPQHDSLIKTALNMFLDKPILGHGPRLFRVKCNDPKYSINNYSCDVHPHNFYIQLLAETGIIGFLFLALLFCYFIYLSIRHIFEYFIHKKKWLSDYQICLLTGLLITIWPFTTNGNIFTSHLMLFYSLQIGFFKKDMLN